MQPYSNFAPTGFDCKGLALNDQQDWLVVPVMQTRDSEALDRSNFRCAERMLEDSKDPDPSECHENHRFGHWACGWIEILIVKPGSDCERIAKEIESSLASYPVLDDDDFCSLETDEFDEQENNAIESLSRIYDLKFEEYYDENLGVHWYVTSVTAEDCDEILERVKQEGLELEIGDDDRVYVRLKRNE